MSMCASVITRTLTDFYVVQSIEACNCPAVWFNIYDREMYEYVPERVRGLLESFCIKAPALQIDTFSVIISELDSVLSHKIYPSYGEEATRRFFEEFIEAFYPEKKGLFVVKFSKNVCIIDNAHNEGESSADFTLVNRQWSYDHKDYDYKKALKHPKRSRSLRDYIED